LEEDRAEQYIKENVEDEPDPFSELDELKEEQLIQLRKCLVRLMDKQKECLTRFYFEEQPYKEISTQLDISWSRVRSLIQNGKRNLKICMKRS